MAWIGDQQVIGNCVEGAQRGRIIVIAESHCCSCRWIIKATRMKDAVNRRFVFESRIRANQTLQNRRIRSASQEESNYSESNGSGARQKDCCACEAGIVMRARNWRILKQFQNVNSISSQRDWKQAKGIEKGKPKGSKACQRDQKCLKWMKRPWLYFLIPEQEIAAQKRRLIPDFFS